MSPVRGPRRRGSLRIVAAAAVTAVVVGGAVGFGIDEWDRIGTTDRPTATAPPAADTGARAEPGNAIPLGGPAPALPPRPTADDVAEAATPAVVTIWTDIPGTASGLRARGAGTGIVLTSDGLVLTNNHVVSGTSHVTATHVTSGVDHPAQILGYDRTRDIALLQLEGVDDEESPAAGLPTAALGDAQGLRLDQPVVAIGNAGGTGSLITSPGIVTAFDQTITAQDPDGASEHLDGVIQIAADINPGDSGGPLLDMTGHVVAVNTAKSESAEAQASGGRGYAVPIEDALRVARSILSGETTDTVHVGPTAILGVHVRTRRAEPPVGAEIVSVLPRTPAATAGFEAGDVITAVNERRISGADDLSATIDRSAPGDTIDVRWVDAAGNVFTSPVTLDEGLPR